MEKRRLKGKARAIERMEKSKFGMYNGPINVGENKTTGKVDVVNLHSNINVNSNALGVAAGEITFNPNTTTEWASFAARYREYRVLAVEIHCIPRGKVNLSTLVASAIYTAMNKGGALGTPTSNGQVHALAKSKVHSTCDEWKYTIRADDYTDLDVGSTSTPGSEFSFLFYSEALTASASYFNFAITWVVQFSSTQ